MVVSLEIEISVLCITILFIMVYGLKSSNREATDDRYFMLLCLLLVAVLGLDMIQAIMQGNGSIFVKVFMYIMTCLESVGVAFIGVAFLDYTMYSTSEVKNNKRKVAMLAYIPAAILILLAIGTPFGGWLYVVDALNFVHPGRYYIIQQLILACYLVYSLAVLIYGYNETNSRERHLLLRKMIFFNAVPLVACLIQLKEKNLPIVWPACTISILIVFIGVQNNQISRDGLTKINNRGRLNEYLEDKCESIALFEVLTCILIDVDDFKKINDNLGHQVGDEALITIANILKKACADTFGSHFIARYGGDEFIIISSDREFDHCDELIDKINEIVDAENASHTREYVISLSMGKSKYKAGKMTIDQFIEIADEDMYNKKQAKKAARKEAAENV